MSSNKSIIKELLKNKKLLALIVAGSLSGTGCLVAGSNINPDENNEEIIIVANDNAILGSQIDHPKNTQIECCFQSPEEREQLFYDAKFKSDSEYIEYYSKVYNLNPEITTKLIKDIIFEDDNSYERWNKKNMLFGEEYVSKELAILKIISDIKYNPGKYNLELNEITSKEKYEVTLSPEELTYKYSSLLGVNPEIALCIEYTECGQKMGAGYLSKNNPAGLAGMSFENKEIGIIYYITMLREKYGCTEKSDIEFIYASASRYCECPEHWIQLCSGNLQTIRNNQIFDKIAEKDLTLVMKK